MSGRTRLWRALAASALTTAMMLAGSPAHAAVPSYPFVTPVFGLSSTADGSLLVADAGSGIVELRKGTGTLIAALPGVTDVDATGRGDMFAVTGGFAPQGASRLYRVSHGSTREIANLGAFEATVNPDGGEIDSNPFDVEALTGGTALVADAGGNDLLAVDAQGNIDWIATLPDQLVPTANAKKLLCPNPPPEFAFVCDLPEMIPAQAVATSIAIGPDGAYYVGELKGFPAPTGYSRIWRIEPGTRHAHCGASPACTVVGTLYVVELDEASWLAVELGLPGALGGTVNACRPVAWTCAVVASGLPMPIAATVVKNGIVYVLINALVPGAAKVIAL